MPKFLNHVDLNKNELQNAKAQVLGSDPSPAAGDGGYLWYNSTSKYIKHWDGTAVQTLTNILEGVTGSGAITAGAITGKSQAISIAAASASVVGTMSTAHWSLVNGATAANTASTIVLRDGSGNFTAGTITAALTGTASIATTLAPTADVPMGSHKLTGLLDPTSAQDAATKNYVDALSIGLDVKASVRAASVANVTQATYNSTGGTSARGQMTATINVLDGITLVAGNRILLKNQTTGAQNGIWVVTTAGTGVNGTWDRATDFDTDPEVTSGAFTFVEEGSTNAASGWVLSTINPITIGGASGTALAFAQFSGGGTYIAGNGLTLTGSTFDVVGTTNRISVAADSIDISSSYVGQASITTLGTITTGVWTGTTIAVANGGTGGTTAALAKTNLGFMTRYAVTFGDGAATSYTITHSLGTLDVVVAIVEVSTGNEVFANVTHATTNTLTLAFTVAPASNALRVSVIG